MLVVVGVLIGLVAGGIAGAVLVGVFGASKLGAAQRERQQLLADANREADALRREAQIEAREESVQLRAAIEIELQERRAQMLKIEERVVGKEEESDQKLTELTRREQGIADREVHIRQLQEELKQAKDGELAVLERLSGMTVGEAKSHLLERSEDLVRHELARSVRQLEEEARNEAKRRARNLVADALQRVAAEPRRRDDRLARRAPVGRHEGADHRPRGPQHPRAREPHRRRLHHRRHAPQAVVLSGFDGVRREIARLTLRSCSRTGGSTRRGSRRCTTRRRPSSRTTSCKRAHRPSSRRTVRRARPGAREGARAAEVPHELRPERAQALGRGRAPRRDHGRRARRRRQGGEAGGAAARPRQGDDARGRGPACAHRRRSSPPPRRDARPSHAIEAHHYEVQPQTVEAVLLIAADAISGARPGARGESLENYIKRLEALEELAGRSRASRRSTRSRPAARSASS